MQMVLANLPCAAYKRPSLRGHLNGSGIWRKVFSSLIFVEGLTSLHVSAEGFVFLGVVLLCRPWGRFFVEGLGHFGGLGVFQKV
jgi:hypothetical protein